MGDGQFHIYTCIAPSLRKGVENLSRDHLQEQAAVPSAVWRASMAGAGQLLVTFDTCPANTSRLSRALFLIRVLAGQVSRVMALFIDEELSLFPRYMRPFASWRTQTIG